MKIRHFLLCTVLAVALSVTGCGARGGVKKYFAFRERDFRAELVGTLNGVSFSATLHGEKKADGTWCGRLEYHAPAALEGVSLCREGTGQVSIFCEEMTAELSKEAMKGLLLPLDAFLGSGEALQSVQRRGRDTELCLESGICLTLSEDGTPKLLSAKGLSISVVRWRTEAHGRG